TGTVGDMTLYAKWGVQTYTLQFLDDDLSVISSVDYEYGADLSTATPTDPEKTGYTFAGWDTTLPSVMPNNDITVTATYSINQYSITFDSNDGSTVATITEDYGTTVSEPTDPEKEGYDF